MIAFKKSEKKNIGANSCSILIDVQWQGPKAILHSPNNLPHNKLFREHCKRLFP